MPLIGTIYVGLYTSFNVADYFSLVREYLIGEGMKIEYECKKCQDCEKCKSISTGLLSIIHTITFGLRGGAEQKID